MRRAFQLSEEDARFLESRSHPWETIIEGDRWVIIEGYEIPAGYNHQSAAVALRLPPSYPDTQIDMAYFLPPLARADKKTMNALTPLQMDGRTWQQWSRHRVGPDAWRPSVDNIQSHLLYVTNFLQEELLK